MELEKARLFIYRNARPLDLAQWKYFFEDGTSGRCTESTFFLSE